MNFYEGIHSCIKKIENNSKLLTEYVYWVLTDQDIGVIHYAGINSKPFIKEVANLYLEWNTTEIKPVSERWVLTRMNHTHPPGNYIYETGDFASFANTDNQSRNFVDHLASMADNAVLAISTVKYSKYSQSDLHTMHLNKIYNLLDSELFTFSDYEKD